MRYAAALLAALVLAVPAGASAQTEPPVVVELFTSQGCPACPPAEAYMRELAGRRDVVALEYHIDYYDYGGWKDPFGAAAHTKRWRAYALALGARYEYTPFMVIGGDVHVVGSDRDRAEQRIRAEKAGGAAHPTLKVETEGPQATVTVDGGGPAGIYDILMVTYDRERKTRVTAGENRGKMLVEANVVRGLERVGQWAGEPVRVTAKLPEMQGGSCAVLLQRAGGGPIVAAASFALDR